MESDNELILLESDGVKGKYCSISNKEILGMAKEKWFPPFGRKGGNLNAVYI